MNDIDVAAHLEGVLAADKANVVHEFKATFNAVNRGVGFTAEVRVPGYIHTDIGTARKLRKAKVDPAAGDLRAKLIKGIIADDGVMLKSEVEVAGLTQARACTGILTEDLILRSGRKAGEKRG